MVARLIIVIPSAWSTPLELEAPELAVTHPQLEDRCPAPEDRSAQTEEHLFIAYRAAFDVKAVFLTRDIEERGEMSVTG